MSTLVIVFFLQNMGRTYQPYLYRVHFEDMVTREAFYLLRMMPQAGLWV